MPFSWDINADDVSGDQISVDEATDVLVERLRGVDPRLVARLTGGSGERFKMLVRRVVEELPGEALTDEFVANMGLRSLLLPIATNQADQLGFDDDAQQLWQALYTEHSQQLRTKLQTELTTAATNGLLPSDIEPGDIPMYVESLLADDVDALTLHQQTIDPDPEQKHFEFFTPTVDPNTGAVVANPQNNAAGSDFLQTVSDLMNGSTTSAIELPAFMTDEDVQFMFRTESAESSIDTYLTELGGREQVRDQVRSEGIPGVSHLIPPDSIRVDLEGVDGVPRKNYQAPTNELRPQDQGPAQGQKYRLSQALNLPFSMSREQVTALSDKMKRAGIYMQIDGGEPAVMGDPTDPQFRRAYKLLLSKSIQTGSTVTNVLETSMASVDEAQADMLRVSLTDPARLRIAADTLGKNILGRKMTAKEQAQLVRSIHAWQRDEAEQAFDMTTNETGGELTEVDWQARMEEMIRAENPGEAGAHDTMQQYEQFRGLIAGPGRGVS